MTIMKSIYLQMNNSHQMMDGWSGGFGMGMMIIFWLLILGLIVTLIWFLIRKGSESSGYSDNETSIEILKKRYARGEIDEEQYRRMKDEIND